MDAPVALGGFKKLLSLCGYPQQGSSVVQVVAQSATPVTLTGSTDEFIFRVIPVPANLLGPRGALRITALWSYPNGASGKTPRVYFGGVAFCVKRLTTALSNQTQTIIRNRDSVAAQVGFAPSAASDLGSSGAVVQTGSVDTSAPQEIKLTGTLEAATDSLTLEGYTVEVLRG